MSGRDLEGRAPLSETKEATTACGQLELALPEAKSASVLYLAASRSSACKPAAASSSDASKRILDFAATLPDW